LRDLGLSSGELADVVRLVLSQSLVRTLCEDCRTPVGDGRFAKGSGCRACAYAGERGRAAVAEYLVIDPQDHALLAAFRQNDQAHVDAVVRGVGLTKSLYAAWLQLAGVLDASTAPQALLS
jgi:general secretion pathway protein E